MSFKDLMLEKKDSVESLFVKFSQLKSNKRDDLQNNIFCFYEGKDAQYYIPRIRFVDNNCSIHDYRCNGKQNVIKINKIIKEKCNIEECKILFFVDKDFDDNSNLESDIYITPYYAIENFYVKDNVVKDFLAAELQLNINNNENDNKDYSKALELFLEKRKHFISNVLLLNAWYSLQIRKGKGREPKPNLKDIKEYKKLPVDISLSVLKEKTNDYVNVEENEIELEMVTINKNPLENMRGKYFMEFMYEYLTYITSEEAKTDGVVTKRRSIPHTIGKNNLVSLLSQYAETPNSLKLYLQSRLNSLKSNIAS